MAVASGKRHRPTRVARQLGGFVPADAARHVRVVDAAEDAGGRCAGEYTFLAGRSVAMDEEAAGAGHTVAAAQVRARPGACVVVEAVDIDMPAAVGGRGEQPATPAHRARARGRRG
ncbi:hypothetical protein CATMIT_01994 [Catenibacterium mitsuokai DSM 15897]|nr:hypothetical protein CATMIT_01994 [Catenibacterium mitsuokai DSM 15897]